MQTKPRWCFLTSQGITHQRCNSFNFPPLDKMSRVAPALLWISFTAWEMKKHGLQQKPHISCWSISSSSEAWAGLERKAEDKSSFRLQHREKDRRRELVDASSLYHLCETSGYGFIQHTQNQKKRDRKQTGTCQGLARGHSDHSWLQGFLLEWWKYSGTWQDILVAKHCAWTK